MKAIDTAYSGHLFRSRLEARWAVFFDHLNLTWEYEPEGYRLGDGTHYLPDFRMRTPQGKYRWIEIKPQNVYKDAKFDKFYDALWASHSDPASIPFPFLASGTPYQWLKVGHTFCPRCGSPYRKETWDIEGEIVCFPCDMETASGGGHSPESTGVLGITWTPHKGSILLSDEESERWSRLVSSAAVAAQQARFEHGQSGSA